MGLAGVECAGGLLGDSTASRGPPNGSLLCELRWVAGSLGPPLWNRDEDTRSRGRARGSVGRGRWHHVGHRSGDCGRRILARTRKKPHWRQKRQWCRLGLCEKGAEWGFEAGGHLSQEAAASATLGGTGRDRVGHLGQPGGSWGPAQPSGEGWPGMSVVSRAGSNTDLGTRPPAPFPGPKPLVPVEKSQVHSVPGFLICQIDFLELTQAGLPCGANGMALALDEMP